MLAVEYREAQEQIRSVAFSVVPGQPRNEYAWLVKEFEETAEALLTRASDALEDAYDDHKIVLRQEWKEEAQFLAEELERYPWLLVNMTCPPEYLTLKLLYQEWAEDCKRLASCLSTLTTDDKHGRGIVRIWDADRELAAVLAHAAARRIYLDSLES